MADQESGGGGFWLRTVAKGVSTIGGLSKSKFFISVTVQVFLH